MNNVAQLVSLVACASLAQTLGSQVPGWRGDHPAAVTYLVPGSAVDEAWSVRVLGGSNTLEVNKINPAPFLGSENAALPLPGMGLPGDIAYIEGIQPEFLVAGLDAQLQAGCLFHVRVSLTVPRTITVLDQVAIGAQVDPLSIVHNGVDDRIYLFDRWQQQLLVASWDGAEPLPAAAAFAPIPMGAMADWPSWDVSPREGAPGVRMYNSSGMSWEVEPQGAGWSVAPSVPDQPAYNMAPEYPVNGRGPLYVIGPAGQFEMVRLDTGLVVATGTIPAAGQQPFQFNPTSTVVPAKQHMIRSPTNPQDVSLPFYPVNRWGSPSFYPGGLTMAPVTIGASRSVVGDLDFGVVTHASFVAIDPAASLSTDVYLWIAVALPGDPDPVTHIGGTTWAVNIQGGQGPFRLTLTTDQRNDLIGAAFPLPDGVVIAGLRLFFQFAAQDPSGTVVVSDVAETVVHAQSQSQSASTPSAPAGQSQAARSALLEAPLRAYRDVNVLSRCRKLAQILEAQRAR